MANSDNNFSVSPGLVIGLGGTGDWILSLLKRQLYINYGPDLNDSGIIKFLLLDTVSTNRWEKGKTKTQGGFEVKSTEYIHLKEPSTGFYQWAQDSKNYNNKTYRWLRRDIFMSEYPREADWSLEEGAGQLRQFARIALFFTLDQVYQGIWQSLKTIRKITGNDRIPVWIVGSVAGGTGSGIFMDLAVLTKLIDKEHNIRVRTIGGFVLPQVYADVTAAPEQGFAAVRELRRFMSKVKIEDKAKKQGKDTEYTLQIGYGPNKIYYQNATLFDNLVFFNETCKNDDARRSYFNKVVDGISVLFDRGGARQFYEAVINADEEKVADFSTYRIFVPIRLYEQKFKYQHLSQILYRLFPTEDDLTIKLPAIKKATEIYNTVDTFLNGVAPYFQRLRNLKNDDARIENLADTSRGRPKEILDELLGFNNIKEHYNDPEITPNCEANLKNLYGEVLDEHEKPSKNEIKKNCQEAKDNYKKDIDHEYFRFMEDTIPRARKDVVDLIKDNFRRKLMRYLADGLPEEFGVSEYYYLLNYMHETLVGKNPDNPTDITRVIEKVYKTHFHKYQHDVNSLLQRALKSYEDAKPVSKFFIENSTPVENAMDDYKNVKIQQLRFMQSMNAFEILSDVHNSFSSLVLELRRQLEEKNNEISIKPTAIRNRFNRELQSINGALEAAGGSHSSIGLKTLGATDYEAHLEEQLFSESPYTDIRIVFDFDKHRFQVKYKKIDKILTDSDPELWNQIEEDVVCHINDRMGNFDGIIAYLKWAKWQFDGKGKGGDFIQELLSSLKDAKSSSQKQLKVDFHARLIHGDPRYNAQGYEDIKKLLGELETQLSQETGCENEGNICKTGTLDLAFSDKNALIYLISSNKVDPYSIPDIENMESSYKRYLTDRIIPWRAEVYHNSKCDWRMWEIERSIMQDQGQIVKYLTSGSFYWVLEEDEMVELFVHAVVAGVIRKENYGIFGQVWVCGKPGQTYKENENSMDMILLTGWDQDKRKIVEDTCMFRAMVTFCINRKDIIKDSVKNIDEIKETIETWIEDAVEKEGGWQNLAEAQTKKMGLENHTTYNPQSISNDYDSQKDLFLKRVFKYYLNKLV